MAKVYAELIKKGLKIISDVPQKIRAAVQALLDVEAAGGLMAGEGDA